MSATSYSSGRQGVSAKDLLRPESFSQTAPSPFSSFPTKGAARTAFLKKLSQASRSDKLPSLAASDSLSLASSEPGAAGQWLFPDRIDPSFGVDGKSERDQLSKAFRRLASSGVFARPTDADASLSSLRGDRPPAKKLVLVEEARLRELIQLDNALRRERELLGQQCSAACDSYHLSARLPLPATRFAVHSLCSRQMHHARSEIMKLQEEWSRFCKENHYNKPHLFLKNSYLKNAPPSQRALKLRLVREATETWQLRKERDTMTFEDSLSLLTCSYLDAQQREKDYECYFVLASRYGPMSEEEFLRDERPGRRYFLRATKGALKLQLLWDRFWAMAKLRRFRACRLIQKHIRRYLVYKRLHPIIRMRLKIGKKTYYMFCFARWKEYNHLVRLIRDAFAFHLSSWKDLCFTAWKRHVAEARNHRTKVLAKISNRIQNGTVFRVFLSWRQYIHDVKDLKRRLRRLFGFPHFDMWLQYVSLSKKLKQLHFYASKIQALMRCFLDRNKFLRKVSAHRVLRSFAHMIRERHFVQSKRDAAIAKEYSEWRPEEELRRTARLNETEKQRLKRRQLFVQEKERAALKELHAHFSTRDGQQQLQLASDQQLLQEHNNEKPLLGWSTELRQKAVNSCASALSTECRTIVRKVEGFCNDAKYPCFLRCVNPLCGATFTTETQFKNHFSLSPVHDSEDAFIQMHRDAYASLTLLLRHQKGIEAFRTHFLIKCGMSGAVNMIDLWLALQDLKKSAANSAAFYKKWLVIWDLFLCDDAQRTCNIAFDCKEAIASRLLPCKYKDKVSFPGYFHRVEAHVNPLLGALGMALKEYVEWSSRHVLDPQCVYDLEFTLFSSLLNVFVQSNDFHTSSHYAEYLRFLENEKMEADRRMFADFKEFRWKIFLDWARDFKHRETLMSKKAFEAVDFVLLGEIDRLFDMAQRVTVRETVTEKRHTEQERHEREMIFADECTSWAEENILNFIFDFYTRSLLDAMWKVPDFRKGMLQYSGLLKSVMTKRMKLEIANAGKLQDSDRWFDDFFLFAEGQERRTFTSGKDLAAVVIQKRIRGILARRKAKKLFAETYRKYIDPNSQLPYYYNVRTQESSWTPPRIFKILYKKDKW